MCMCAEGVGGGGELCDFISLLISSNISVQSQLRNAYPKQITTLIRNHIKMYSLIFLCETPNHI